MDLRLEILHEIKNREKSTEELIANSFLQALNEDLGSLRRALIELLDEGLIGESNVTPETSIVRNKLDSSGPPSVKSSKRLTNGEIGPIRLFITLKGTLFLIEEKKLRNELLLSEWNRYARYAIYILAILGILQTTQDIISWFTY